MSGIFRLDYIQNLNRVNSKASTPDRVEKRSHKFSELLADIEKREKLASKSEVLGQLKEQSNSALREGANIPILSNLKDDDVRMIQSSATLETNNNREAKTDINTVGVKSPAIPVKITPAVNGANEIPIALEIKAPPATTLVSKAINAFSRLSDSVDTTNNTKGVFNIIKAAGRYHGLDPHLALAVAKAESSFNTKAISSDGFNSKGLFQLLDSTARDMIKRLGIPSKYKPFDAGNNSHLGVGYLRYLHDIFSNGADLGGNLRTYQAKSAADLEKFAVAAFNVGEGAVAEAQFKAKSSGYNPGEFSAVRKFLPASTRDYVTRVADYKKSFDAKGSNNSVS